MYSLSLCRTTEGGTQSPAATDIKKGATAAGTAASYQLLKKSTTHIQSLLQRQKLALHYAIFIVFGSLLEKERENTSRERE